jgi:transcriptional regulator with XRE-family HTH domain
VKELNYDNESEYESDIKETLENITLWIKTERIRARLSQLELSLRAGLSQNHIYSIESGHRFPNMGTFLKICKALNLNPEKTFKAPDKEREKDKEAILALVNKYI